MRCPSCDKPALPHHANLRTDWGLAGDACVYCGAKFVEVVPVEPPAEVVQMAEALEFGSVPIGTVDRLQRQLFGWRQVAAEAADLLWESMNQASSAINDPARGSSWRDSSWPQIERLRTMMLAAEEGEG